MKKLTLVLIVLLMGVAACDRDAVNQAGEEVTPGIEPIESTALEAATEEEVISEVDESLITPDDLSEEAQDMMYRMLFDYNKCMLTTRLEAAQQRQQIRESANAILALCEPYMESLKAHLLAHNVNKPLVIGLTKKSRSKAARQLMTQGMNPLAAQASVVINTENMEAEEE